MRPPVGRPYSRRAGEGWTNFGALLFPNKGSELGQGRRATVVEYATKREEPPDHIRGATEADMFYVLEGAFTSSALTRAPRS